MGFAEGAKVWEINEAWLVMKWLNRIAIRKHKKHLCRKCISSAGSQHSQKNDGPNASCFSMGRTETRKATNCWWTCQTENQAVKPTTSHKPHMRVTSHMETNASLMDPRWIPQEIQQRILQRIPQGPRDPTNPQDAIGRSIGWNLRSSHNFFIISEPNVLIWLR